MSDGNVQLSLTNLTQMDRHQTDSHRAPVVNQVQNAELAREEAAQRLKSPAPPDQAEGKIIDPRAKREEEQRKKRKRRQQEQAENAAAPPPPRNGSGRFIDFEA
jgi:hypothetical protein